MEIRDNYIKEAYEDGVLVAKVDDTYRNDVKVILCDTSEKYIQRFFMMRPIDKLVKQAQLMRKIGIKSL